MSGTYSGSDKRLAYLFENGGGGGGGTTVVANPSGEATDDLEKLQVGETIYDIPTGGSSTLAGLDDVNISTPADGDVLKYDETNDEWVNGAVSSGGGELYLNTIYSETEEKVGYWTDGKPLYQKTLVYNQSYTYATSNWGEIPFSNVPANIERVRIFDVEQLDPSGDVYFDNRVRYFYSNSKVYGISTQSQHTVAGLIITIQYTKTTDTPEVPQRGNVIYLPTIYSQEEREVGVWEDGKPLYQKSFSYSGSLDTTGYFMNTLATLPSDVQVVTSIKGQIVRSDSGWATDIIYSFDGGIRPEVSVTDYKFETRYYNGEIQAAIKGYSDISLIMLTIQYTKTTDTAGSGSWTPSGAPAVHYSTEEQVVGTWIDGSTLYERTIFEQPTSYSSGGTASISVGNINVHNIKGGVCTSTGSDNIVFGYTNVSPNEYVRIYQSGTSLSIYNSFYSSRPYICATIQYTKSS